MIQVNLFGCISVHCFSWIRVSEPFILCWVKHKVKSEQSWGLINIPWGAGVTETNCCGRARSASVSQKFKMPIMLHLVIVKAPAHSLQVIYVPIMKQCGLIEWIKTPENYTLGLWVYFYHLLQNSKPRAPLNSLGAPYRWDAAYFPIQTGNNSRWI